MEPNPPAPSPAAVAVVLVTFQSARDLAMCLGSLERAAGPHPLEVQPDRAISPGLSFGEGPHKCPGMYVAIQETDIFLTKLFAIDTLDLVAPPKVTHNAAFDSYEIRDMQVILR